MGGSLPRTARADDDLPRVSPSKTAMARAFRRSATPQEAMVWEWVRNRKMLGMKWRRQEVIAGFVADFYCAECRLALEIDGPVHDSAEAVAHDRLRDKAFAEIGIRTLRIGNDGCTCEAVYRLIKVHDQAPSPPRPPLPPSDGEGGGECTPPSGAQPDVARKSCFSTTIRSESSSPLAPTTGSGGLGG